MTKPRSKTPIESFGSELFNALIEGSKRKIEVKTSYRKAVTLRLRLHQLRTRMREESHPLYPVAAKTRITISWDSEIEEIATYKKIRSPKNTNSLVTMTLAPQDSEYHDLFKSAGLDLKPIDHALFTDSTTPTSPETEPTPTLEDLFKDFK